MRSPKYLSWVRSLPCRLCGAVPSEAHHIRGVGHLGGMGLKATDLAAMPLCSFHHRLLHDRGYFKDRQFEWALQTLRYAVQQGRSGPLRRDLDSTHITLQGRDHESVWRELSGLVEEVLNGGGEGVCGRDPAERGGDGPSSGAGDR